MKDLLFEKTIGRFLLIQVARFLQVVQYWHITSSSLEISGMASPHWWRGLRLQPVYILNSQTWVVCKLLGETTPSFQPGVALD
jgi:hypothetical protein